MDTTGYKHGLKIKSKVLKNYRTEIENTVVKIIFNRWVQ